MSNIGDTFYRYEDVRYAPPLDEFDNVSGPGRVEILLRTYLVTKTTPCGVWLDQEKFVNQKLRKQFAHSTKEAAHEAFLARKSRQRSILKAQLRYVEDAITLATKLAKKDQK